jgi:hypothetical protein
VNAKRAVLIGLLSILIGPPGWGGECSALPRVACPHCFAVVVLPDTQFYTDAVHHPHGAAHLDLVTRYLCRERTAWVEPSTGKQMPILMALQLGDLVQSGDRREAGALAEWERVDAAFDNLDACRPRVPFLVTNGNHDAMGWNYEGRSEGYEAYFGESRWRDQGLACETVASCDFEKGQFFLGGGDPIVARSRNHLGEGGPGPRETVPGRHRAGLIRSPQGRRFLFLGLEMAFDFPPAAPGFEALEGDDAAWPRRVLRAYEGVPTIVFHHSLFLTGPPVSPELVFGPETWRSDSLEAGGVGMKALWDELIEPSPQVLLAFSGHVVRPAPQGDYRVERKAAPPVHGFLRNFQGARVPGTEGFSQVYGAGWNVFVVFDPDAGQIRVRSLRIDDTDAYASPRVDLDHDGEPAATECFDADYGGFGERIIDVDFEALGG